MEKFNFSQPADQKKFEELPSEQKEQIIEDAHEEASKKNWENTLERVKNLEWSKGQSCSEYLLQRTIDEYNKGVVDEKRKWRMPTKDELVASIEQKLIDNTPRNYDNTLRWSWSGTKVLEKRYCVEYNEDETGIAFEGMKDTEVHLVVKYNGDVDTAAMNTYGLRLVRDKK